MATTKTIAWGDGSSDNLSLTANSWSGNETVTVVTPENFGAARNATIVFYSTKNAAVSASLRCTQAAATSSISPTSLSWSSQDQSAKTVTVTTNISTANQITATLSSSTYFTVSKAAISDGKCVVTVTPKQKNTSSGAYSATLTLKVGRLSVQTVSLSQAANAIVSTTYKNQATTLSYSTVGNAPLHPSATNDQGTISGVCTRIRVDTYQDGTVKETKENYSPTMRAAVQDNSSYTEGVGEDFSMVATPVTYTSTGVWKVTWKHGSLGSRAVTNTTGSTWVANLSFVAKSGDFEEGLVANVPCLPNFPEMESLTITPLRHSVAAGGNASEDISIGIRGTARFSTGVVVENYACSVVLNESPLPSWVRLTGTPGRGGSLPSIRLRGSILPNTGSSSRTAILDLALRYATAVATPRFNIEQAANVPTTLELNVVNNRGYTVQFGVYYIKLTNGAPPDSSEVSVDRTPAIPLPSYQSKVQMISVGSVTPNAVSVYMKAVSVDTAGRVLFYNYGVEQIVGTAWIRVIDNVSLQDLQQDFELTLLP